MYRDSAPSDYLDILDGAQIPYVLSPWHDKDVNKETGELKKPHKHGVLFFDSLKSYSQVSELLTEKLHTPSHVEIVMSASGLYNYFTHAENPEKTKYDPNDIESGCGFDRKKFLLENDYESLLAYALDIIDTMGFTEFGSLVSYARKNDPDLLRLIIQKTYFFSRLLDSMRYSKREEQFKDLEKSKLLMQPKKNNKKKRWRSGSMTSSELTKLIQIERLLISLTTLAQSHNHENKHYNILTQKELLSLFKISPNTLKSWEKTGLKRLEPPIEGTRTVYYKMEDVINYLTP